ncbi:hypothetical protein GMSM_14320 [Geomonas sp. Red276]
MKADQIMRNELMGLLQGANAHMSCDDAVAEFPIDFLNRRPPNTPYSFWHFVEHLRIAQWDILEFIRNPDHISPDYPQGYRPGAEQKTDEAGWYKSCDCFRRDLASLMEMVRNQSLDLLAPIPHARNYTIYREILTVADHNA